LERLHQLTYGRICPSSTILNADKVTELDAFPASATSPPFPGFALGLMIHWRWRNEPDKNRLKTSAIIAVIFSSLLINLLLNNRRLLCCFYAKHHAIQLHQDIYLYLRPVASTRSINSQKNNLWWTSHGLFKASKNRNQPRFNRPLNFLFYLFNRRNITLRLNNNG
jgi:hypothetical protein